MTLRALIWSTRARRELREIGKYIASDKPEAASRWVEALAAVAERAAAMLSQAEACPSMDETMSER